MNCCDLDSMGSPDKPLKELRAATETKLLVILMDSTESHESRNLVVKYRSECSPTGVD